jgi:arginyl-tRNA synthetase
VFDLGLAVRQDSENPVYYAQYAHARICSLIARLRGEGYPVPPCSGIDAGLLRAEPERDLIKRLALLPEEVAVAARDLDPSRINKYVIELATRFHKFYTDCRILGEERALLDARLKLADAVRSVIANCLGLLGVTAPEKM